MHQTKFALAVLAAAVLAGCGGATGGDQTLKVKYSSQVSFGDSLSDVGSYAVGTVAKLGGGKFTINGDNTKINPELTGKNWTEHLAAQFSLPVPCAAETGLEGDATLGLAAPRAKHAGCFGYAMGGSRVTNPIGPNNKLTGSALGALTVPVVTQIANHLAVSGGKFSGTEAVFVMAGGNDVLFLLGDLQAKATIAGQKAGATAGADAGAKAFAANLVAAFAAGAPNPATAAQSIGAAVLAASTAPGATSATIVGAAVQAAVLAGNTAVGTPAGYGPLVAKAQADATVTGNAAGAAAGAKAGADYAAVNGPALVGAMKQAGTELVALVKDKIIANGANYVVVNNLPDVAGTPSGLSKDTNTKALISAMVSAFNGELSGGLNGNAKVLLVDVFAVSHDQGANPGPYGLTNVTETACDLTPAKNVLGSSLVCTAANLKAGDVSHYAYADDVHPTPFNNLLLARYVAKEMVVRGWL